MRKTILLVLLCSALFSQAQAPWRARLFVHFETNGVLPPSTDTLWFGCDSLGNEGYQPNLDVLDSFDSSQENKVYFIDETAQTQFGHPTPHTLTKSIKAFNKNGILTFKVKAFGYVHAISWDTTEFIYEQPDFNLNNVYVKCIGCYAGSWEIEEKGIFARYPDGTPTFGSKNSMNIKQGAYMRIDVILRFKDTSSVGINENHGYNQLFKLAGNPVYDEIRIRFNESFSGRILLFDNIGRVVLQTIAVSDIEKTISATHLSNGIYYLQLTNHNNQSTKPIKLFKQ